MICPNCSKGNPDHANYCLNCGYRLLLICSECGTELPNEANYCFKCGRGVTAEATAQKTSSDPEFLSSSLQRLIPKEYSRRLLEAGGQLSPERRLVTILFCDVKGFTPIAKKLDPEAVMEVMNGSFEVMIASVYRYEGTLANLMGDAVLAFFGAPIAHEDDPERAIRAGLDIVAGIKQYAIVLKDQRGIQDFNIRVGINTGLVVVGEVGSDLRVEYTAMGDAVNLAARMEQNAPPGCVLITQDTYQYVRGIFDVQTQKPLWVKGLSEPVQAYLVEGVKSAGSRVDIRGVKGIETPTVGRDLELMGLLNQFRDVLADDETRVVTIGGESGIGKTRLLDEFQIMVELHPVRPLSLRGSGSSTLQKVPYSLWRDIFCKQFSILENDSVSVAMGRFRDGMGNLIEPDRADLVGQFLGFDFSSSPAVSALLGSSNFGQQAQAYLVNYMRSLSTQSPIVLIIDDLQWADDSSLHLLGYLVDEMPDHALLIICATRPEFYQRRPHWGEGLEVYSRMDLKPLSKRSSRELVGVILQKAARIPDSLNEVIVDGAGGNPYFLEELLKMLIEDGVISTDHEQWQVNEDLLTEVNLPVTLNGVLQMRLDRLTWKERVVLQHAAVVGRTFWDAIVAELVPETVGEDIIDILSTLRAREFIYQREYSAFSNAQEYVFKHSLLREVAYESLLHKERRQYHARVGHWFETHSAERLTEYLLVISKHYELAGDLNKASGYLGRSAGEAYRVSAYQDARNAYEHALDLLPADNERYRLTYLVGLGQVLIRLSDLDSASRVMEEGLTLARKQGDQLSEAKVLAGLGNVAWQQGEYDLAENCLNASLGISRNIGDLSSQANAARHMARIKLLKGAYRDSARFGGESHSIYKQLGDAQGQFDALNELGIVAMREEDHDRAREYFTENLELATQIDDRFRIVKALVNLGLLALNMNMFEQSKDYLEQAMALNQEIGNRRGNAIVYLNLGRIYVELEQGDAAWQYLRPALRVSLEIQLIQQILLALIQIARLYYREKIYPRAAELSGLVINHQMSDNMIERNAQPLLDDLGMVFLDHELETALERGKRLQLNGVVEELITHESLEGLLGSAR